MDDAIINPIMKSCFALSLSISFFLIKTFGIEAAPNYLYHDCPNTTLFTPNSAYQSNLDTLLSSLSSAVTEGTNGFANANAGESPPDRAYGLFLCRGDLNTTTCNDCMATGKREILQRCPNQRVSVIWYDECMLRYSNQSIFSIMEVEPFLLMWNVENVSEPTLFKQVLNAIITDVAWRASKGDSAKKFAVSGEVVTSSGPLYALAQCTPDLTQGDCNTCLRFAIPNLPGVQQGGRMLTPSCTVRFELYPFYYSDSPSVGPLASPATTPEAPPLSPLVITTDGKSNKSTMIITTDGKSNKSTMIIIAITVPVGVVMVLLILICLLQRKEKKMREVVKRKSGANKLTTVESLEYDLATMQDATNDFSPENKLGQGGFGEVFLGRLPNGQQIAVKRLSQSSRQGDEEFKNEVLLVAKLQHRNLVRLMGFCLEGGEKLLAYEFVPNKSLDYFLFDPNKRRQVDWPLRYKIISGIARGMLYLHEDSRLRIIHRDLKCGNILLDSEMNPKISDFGMARIFGVDQTQASTNKIVGTFGYMSPEYAMHGEFSVKSDVYSFGILLLEIICGKKNNYYQQLDGGEYLASHVWNQWTDGTPLKVLDTSIVDSYSRDQVLRCLHIGLLCIQEDPAIRPTMATVVLMLNSNYFDPPSPRHPAFFVRSRSRGLSIPMKELESSQSTNGTLPSSTNVMSITELYPR